MNWTELIDRALISFPSDETLRPTARQYLVDAQEDFILETNCLDRWKWFYVAAGLGYIELPSDFVKLNRAEFEGYILKPTDVGQVPSIYDASETAIPGVPGRYYQQGNSLYLYPQDSTAGWAAVWYVYNPNVLVDSDTDYRKLGYDALTAHSIYGETITGGTSGATGVLEFDDNNIKTGTLTLSSVTYNNAITATTIAFVDSNPDTITDSGNGLVTAGFAADQRIKVVAASGTNSGYYTIATVVAGTITLISTDTLTTENAATAGEVTIEAVFTENEALTGSENFAATENGTEAAFATAGDFPDIPDPYRKYLVDYAKASMFDDKGDRRALRAWDKYNSNREMIRAKFDTRTAPGPRRIVQTH